jgi:hypothetical protein
MEQELVRLERLLLERPTRADPAVLERYIADDFEECGAYGDVFGKQKVLEWLPQEPADTVFTGHNFAVKMVTPDVGVVTFTVEKATKDGVKKSIRMSLWTKREAEWQMVYHQGTAIE